MIGTFSLTILLVGAVFIIGLVGFVPLPYELGRGMLRRAHWQHISPVFALLLGLLIILALLPVPVLGGVVFLASTSLGLGATIVSHFGSGEPWNLNSLAEEVTNE